MKIIDLPQGSPEWLEWRKGKRMASESATVLGINPYEKPLALAKKKRGITQSFTNAAMQRGHEYEPEARAWVESELGMFFQPVVLELGDYGASLDGMGQDESGEAVLLEIKVPRSADSSLWKLASVGSIPEHYFAQLTHQLSVSGCDYGWFVVYLPELKKGILQRVEPSPAFWVSITKAWDQFWQEYMVGDMPEIEERTDEEWRFAVTRFLEAKKAADEAAKALEDRRQALITLAGENPAKGFGVTLTKTEKQGAIDYAKGFKTLGIDPSQFEQFRKKGSSYFTVNISKE